MRSALPLALPLVLVVCACGCEGSREPRTGARDEHLAPSSPSGPAAGARTARTATPTDDARDERARGEPEEALGEEARPLPDSPQRELMHERFEAIDLARSALQRGDLAAARTVASTLAFRFPLELPPSLQARADDVPRRALELANAEDLSRAGAAFARLAGTCGDCHAAARATWAWDEPPVPEGSDLEDRMRRHAWANERLWEALVTHDVARFARAAEILAEAPITGLLPPDDERPAGLRAIEERLHTAAREAAIAGDSESRIAAYGRIVTTCGECHARLRATDGL